MNKFFTLLLSLFLLSTQSNAQIADGSVAPDFTAEDIYGNEHNLYELLDQGKTVILDMFATWCGPCWSYHTQHVLEDIYQEYGPNGTDEIYVFAIEGDGNTDVECISTNTTAECSSSWGDWTEGISYPIIDSRSIFSAYECRYYPTLYMVYPDKKVYEMGQQQVSGVLEMYNLGPKLQAGINPVFLESDVLEGSICGEQMTSPTYVIMNQGDQVITSGDITVTYNGEIQYSKAWTGNVEPWGIVENVEIDEFLVNSNSNIEFRMDNINGNSDQSLVQSSDIITDVTNLITLEITTDANADIHNNSFFILSSLGKTIGSATLNIPNHTYKYEYELEDLICHFFSITDAGGDGLLGGTVRLTDSQGRVIYDNADFGNGVEVNFNASMNSSVNDILRDVEMVVAPNPVSDILSVSIALEEAKDLSLTITSVTGETLYQESNLNLPQGATRKTVNISDFNTGMYFISLQNNEGRLTQKVFKR